MPDAETMSNDRTCRDCAEVAVRYFHLIDRRRFREAADLFTEDGVFVRMGKRLIGPDEIFAALDTPDTGKIARHFVHNLMVDIESPERVSVRYDLVTFIHPCGQPAGTVPPVPGPTAVLDCVDEMVRLPAGWRITAKRTLAVFRNG